MRFQLNLQPPHGTDDQEIECAVALAREAEVVLVGVGTTAEVESEGFGRGSLSLPGRQDELVRLVADANPRTAVVVNAGGARAHALGCTRWRTSGWGPPSPAADCP